MLTTNLKVKICITTLLVFLIVGTFVFKFIEPFTWIQAFYFTVTTMTTVGYGDLVPSNDLTRIVVSFYILLSVTLYISLAAFLGMEYLDHHEKRHLEKQVTRNNRNL